MQNLKQKIAEEQTNAMKTGEKERLSTLRLLTAAIANKEIELRKKNFGLSDEEVLDVIRAEAKRRKDAIEEYRKADRLDLVQKEERELAILQEYLPPEISDDDLMRIIQGGIREVGAGGEKDFGKVMKAIMPTLKGKASGDRISATLKQALSAKQ